MDYKHLSHGISAALLIISSITDVKKREIPIYIYFIAAIITIFAQHYLQAPVLLHLVTAVILAVIYFIQALFSSGGGDIVMMSVLGFILGPIPSILMIVFSLPYTAIRFIVCWRRSRSIKDALKEEYPVAPSILCGFSIYIFFNYLYANYELWRTVCF